MYDYIVALVLGIIEGLTEFLPISSTGHLIIANNWFNFSDPKFSETFNMFIQVGAILAIVIIFWKKLWLFDHQSKINPNALDIWIKTIIGVIPALVLGFLFKDFIEEKLLNTITVAISLIVGGIGLIIIERFFQNQKPENVKDGLEEINNRLTYGKAFGIGLIQCLAMVPGVSRSASSIIGGMGFGLSRMGASEFSFFLAIPTLTAASAYFLLKNSLGFTSSQIMILIFGFLVAFVVAFLVVRFFLRYIQKNNFIPFGYYRIVLGLIILAWYYI